MCRNRVPVATVRHAVLILLLAWLALLLAASLVITRNIARPIGRLVTALQAVARRDLTVHMQVRTRDEIGAMAAALDGAVSGMRGRAFAAASAEMAPGLRSSRVRGTAQGSCRFRRRLGLGHRVACRRT